MINPEVSLHLKPQIAATLFPRSGERVAGQSPVRTGLEWVNLEDITAIAGPSAPFQNPSITLESLTKRPQNAYETGINDIKKNF